MRAALDKEMKLNGKVAIVTGASRGIGAAIAERLATEGATIAVNYAKSAKQAESVVETIISRGGKAKTFQADLGDPAQTRSLVNTVFDAFGRIDILVNNAGSFAFAPMGAIDEAQIHSQIGVNLIGPTIATQEALKHFPKEGGRVIIVSSSASTHPLPGLSVYSATKSGLNALARAWAAELGPKGITVNAVSPGPVDTEMFRSAGIDENAKNHMISRTPLGRIGVPSDIADVVAFLASPDGRWVTGQVIEATGGFVP